MHQATIKLKLIKKVLVDEDQLNNIGQFTYSIFKTAIPVFKKREPKFNLQRLLFKFVFLDDQQNIDYSEMSKIVEFNPGQLDEECFANVESELLVRATHTNTDYKLVNTRSGIYPKDKFNLNGKLITYTDYYKQIYDVVINNQTDQLYKLEKADLISLYSIFVKEVDDEERKKINENKTSKFDIYIPKELLIVSPFTKELYKKLNCLPPLIYRIKQKIMLKHICTSLNQDILNIETNEDFENIFDSIRTNQNNIDDYIYEEFKRKNRGLPFFESSSESSTDESGNDEKQDIVEATEQFENTLNMVRKSYRKEAKPYKMVHADEDIVHPSIKQVFLDHFLNESLNSTLQCQNYSSLDNYLIKFASRFESIMSSNNRKIDYKNFEDIEPKLKKRKLDESDDLKNINFNGWMNDYSNRLIITPFNLLEALSAKAAADVINLECLEFLGDCFLKLITCCLLFHLYPDLAVGEMDILKIRAISNKNLYGISRRKQIHEFLFADKFLPGMNWMPDGFYYDDAMPNCPENQVTIIDQSGFRRSKLNLVDRNRYQELKAKCISDGIESLIGAVLVSSGMRNACLFMKYLGIYSDEFVLDLNCESQKDLFYKYDPLEHDLHRDLLTNFSDDIYVKYDFRSLEYIIGYQFENRALLVQAFKHVSYDDPYKFPSYERLEFLGDAVIDYLVVKYFYDGRLSPGQLTNIKQSLINNEFFGTLAVKYGLDKFLIHKNPGLFAKIGEFKEYYEEFIKPKGK